MTEQFKRFELLVGPESLELLKEKKVAVFGLGGVGGNACDALARSGIGNLTIIDNDVVDITNINRQLISNLNVVGQNKVDVMEKHLKSINPDIKITKKKMFYLPDNADELDLSEFDYVVDAIDTVVSKINIIFRCKTNNINVISALGCGNKMDPNKLEITDISKTSYDPLAKVLRRELRKLDINHLKVVYSKEEAIKVIDESSTETKHIPGSSAFVPPVAGIMIAYQVVKDLLEGN